MLLPYTTLVYYGPAAAAMIVADSVGGLQSATPKGKVRSSLVEQGAADAPYFRPVNLRGAGLEAGGVGTMQASPVTSVRAALKVTIGTLSQDDVTGAVLESEIEPGLTLRQALRLIAAATAGRKVDPGGGGVAFRNAVANSKTRITANADRTVVTTDVT